jgi:hypothetical protein
MKVVFSAGDIAVCDIGCRPQAALSAAGPRVQSRRPTRCPTVKILGRGVAGFGLPPCGGDAGLCVDLLEGCASPRRSTSTMSSGTANFGGISGGGSSCPGRSGRACWDKPSLFSVEVESLQLPFDLAILHELQKRTLLVLERRLEAGCTGYVIMPEVSSLSATVTATPSAGRRSTAAALS